MTQVRNAFLKKGAPASSSTAKARSALERQSGVARAEVQGAEAAGTSRADGSGVASERGAAKGATKGGAQSPPTGVSPPAGRQAGWQTSPYPVPLHAAKNPSSPDSKPRGNEMLRSYLLAHMRRGSTDSARHSSFFEDNDSDEADDDDDDESPVPAGRLRQLTNEAPSTSAGGARPEIRQRQSIVVGADGSAGRHRTDTL